ncbi:MAG: GGDEF domain-containing protein [Actinobacteria bacterium]|nr:GGDEF domain-containing protein [Actinomycetota bacterium]
MRIYTLARWFSTIALISYLILRLYTEPTWWSEVIIYNLIAAGTAFAILTSRIPENSIGKISLSCALLAWTLGSISSAIDSFFGVELSTISEISYATFYPLAIYGAIRSLLNQGKSARLEVIDTLVIAFSGSTLLATLFLRPAQNELSGTQLEVFLTIIYPIANLILLLTVLLIVILEGIKWRNFLFLIGISIFVASDFYYIYLSQWGTYNYGSWSDAGWLLGFVVLAHSFWFASEEEEKQRSHSPFVVTVALLLSLLILAISVLHPEYFPRFVLLPAFATIALAFIRMIVAMSDARRIGEERALARTDELTGLANRRRFLAEFEEFSKGAGSLLILDLDGFKPVNDRLGHEAGDQLLAQVAHRFQRVIPKAALLARLGGDEFGALIPGNEGFEIAVALRASLAYPFRIVGESIKLDVSIGEVFQGGGGESQAMLRLADEAMYRAKREGIGICSSTTTSKD